MSVGLFYFGKKIHLPGYILLNCNATDDSDNLSIRLIVNISMAAQLFMTDCCVHQCLVT